MFLGHRATLQPGEEIQPQAVLVMGCLHTHLSGEGSEAPQPHTLCPSWSQPAAHLFPRRRNWEAVLRVLPPAQLRSSQGRRGAALLLDV